MERESEIRIKVKLDENHIPEKMEWEASDTQKTGEIKASFLSVWDPTENTTLRMDLWTKEMTVDEMKLFVYQTVMTMSDSFERATGMKEEAIDMRDFGNYLGQRFGLVKPDNSGSH